MVIEKEFKKKSPERGRLRRLGGVQRRLTINAHKKVMLIYIFN